MAPQDLYIEEEEDTCPLCIEEFDLTDRNFRPCPCGYKVCQFCFNNIKNNMNGLCPACRRPYDEKTIQYKIVTPEEAADFARNIQKNHKKRVQEQKQKEAQKREVEKESRKNLIGVRVVQKNLVYVTGLAPGGREDELLKTLRRPEYFGQYGVIQKISISNRKSPDGQHHSLGVYVTFEKNEDALKCIQAVHGSVNGERVLKAQYGTTKYCSAWLKFEKCNNPGCMFLHEKADEENSYSRQDLSSMNSILSQTQRPLSGGGGPSSARAASRQMPSQPTPPPLAAQAMQRSSSKEGTDTPVDSSALPSSASWARNPQRSRRGSHATTGTASSPAVSASLPATNEATEEAVEEPQCPPGLEDLIETYDIQFALAKRPDLPPSSELLKVFAKSAPAFNHSNFPKELRNTGKYFPMFDMHGGEKRRRMREEDETARVGDGDEQGETQVASEGEPEISGGSLALGGEPEERDMGGDGHGFEQRQAQPPIQRGSTDGILGGALAGSGFGFGHSSNLNRSMTPQHLAMRGQSAYTEQLPPGISSQSTMFQGPGHNRQSSRYSFANDNSTSATAVKLAGNSRAMAQQSSMMPNYQTPGSNQYYPSTIAGPPPGLKSTGTPPSMYSQFGAAGMGGAPRESSNELLQNVTGRNRGGGNQPHDAGKLDLVDPSILQARMQHQSQSNAGVGQGLFGSQSQDDELALDPEARSYVDQLVDDPPNVFTPANATTSMTPGPSAPPGFSSPHRYTESSFQASSSPAQARLLGVTPAVPKMPLQSFDRRAIIQEQTTQKSATASETQRKGKSAASNNDVPAVSPAEPAHGRHRAGLSAEEFPTLAAATAFRKQTTSPAVLTPPSPFLAPGSKKLDKGKAPDKPPQMAAEKAPEAVPGSPVPPSKPTGKRAGNATKAGNRAPPVNSEDVVKANASGRSSAQSATLAQQAAPKAIRVMPVNKADIPSQPSPVPSVAAKTAAGFQRPDTPGSEMVSDTASMVSASVDASRAGSPPPARVGTAAVRASTKSSQRKERKKAMKEETKIIVEAPKSEPEEHAPILGRKKKQKKDKPSKAPTAHTQEETSLPTIVKDEEPSSIAAKQNAGSNKTPVEVDAKAKSQGQKKSAKAKTKEKEPQPEPPAETPQQPAPAAVEPQPEVQPPEQDRPNLNPFQAFQAVRALVWRTAVGGLQMLRPVGEGRGAGGPPRQDHGGSNGPANKSGYCKDCACKCGEVNENDLATLRAGKPVRKKFHTDGSRMMITPNGDCIRSLTPEEEDAFLELQAAIAETADNPGVFVAPRHQPGSGAFSLIKGRAVPNGRPNIFPTTSQPQSHDPIGKMQREDALSYINQYVLPRLNLGASNMGFPKGASPGRDSAAASLNSLAPYFYGPDAAAGVGIYSAPEGARAMQDFTGGAGVVAHGEDGPKVPGGGGSGFGGMPLMSVEDAEMALAAARKETEKLEKGLNAVIKRNRRLLLGSGN
ncbi:RING-type E3 ubiquitin transferase [Purpureocillium takamizusanense]|uniref:RING-type E3 ubiquitin transferase n=1 Tax=Purpureocillium takamizusanense TaxID=2060973 RepID=A0A9Q8QFU0_9HYPO|nr:RING-type E3 ubiquitin transferase [Purpureocillium takamizusanense]UNI18091.1 RING-type E3 ubiquitin transferase [Purpureocillium takamizusanense]